MIECLLAFVSKKKKEKTFLDPPLVVSQAGTRSGGNACSHGNCASLRHICAYPQTRLRL